MSTTANYPAVVAPRPPSKIPWYIWVGVVAITSSSIGGAWDVSWHRSIGRDTFWTPAHMAIYACGVLAGLICAWLIAECTFGHDPELKAASVNVFGLRAPLGIFLAGWGCVAVLTSAPFDNWWHNAYGLDVKIVSPPHALLILGLRGIATGVMFLILAAMNRAAENDQATFRRLQIMLLYVGGLATEGQMFFIQEYTWDVKLHQVAAYIAMGIALPFFFATFSQATRSRWASTFMAAVYTLFGIGLILILPLFPAEPKLGPVYHPVTHFIPPKFPILILVPAIVLDLLWHRLKNWKLWQIALVSGVVFIAVLTVVEWNFGKFLLSDASKNWFFGTNYFDYNSRPNNFDQLRKWLEPDGGRALYTGLLWAAVYATISTWLGLLFGRWMRGVRR
jgi:ABC-type Fe3+-siderophore transport system permease subunit